MPEIVGREAELAESYAFIEELPSGPRALVLEGEAGIGKTTLWEAAIARAERSGIRVLRCRPAESEARMAYSGWMDLFRDVGHVELDGLPEPQRSALDVALLRSAPSRKRADPRAVSAGTLGVLRSLSERSPILIAIDDQQWLDRESAFLVEYCARRLGDEPVGFLACGRLIEGRSDPLHLRAALRDERFRHVAIHALPPSAIGSLLVARFGVTLPYPTIRRIHEAVGGNPLYAIEVGRAMQESCDWTDHEIPVPADVRDLVRSRIAGLDAGAREIVEISSACARPSVAILASMLGGDAALRHLADAESAEILVSEHDVVRFVHPLFAAAAYSAMSTARRCTVHRRLASAIPDAEERAHHLALGSEPPDETVAATLEAEAERTAGRGAPIAAAELFEEAARFTSPDRADTIGHLMMRASDQHFLAGGHERAVELVEECLAVVHPGPDRASALLRLGRLLFYRDLPRAAEVLGEAEAEDAPPAIQSQVHVLATWVARDLLDLDDAVRHAEAAVRLADEARDDEAFVCAVGALCAAQEYSGTPVDRELLDRAVVLEGSVRLLTPTDGARWILAGELWTSGRYEEGRRIYEDILATARAHGDEMSLTDMLLNLGELEATAGNWDAALEYWREMYEFDLQIGYPAAVPACRLATIEAHRGDLDDADRHVAEALASVRTHAEQFRGLREFDAIVARGTVDLVAGDLEDAARCLEDAHDRLMASRIREPWTVWRLVADLCEILVELGRADEAEGVLHSVEAMPSDIYALGLAGRARGLLAAARGDHAGAADELEAALEHARAVDAPFERARTLLVLGTVRRHAKLKSAARETLQAARAIFERVGAAPWVDRVDAELASIGGRRPPPAGQLTPTEGRVARLAAAGRTNREIAGSLFLSVRTVESHLSHAYAKLGVRSRTELAAVLDPLEGSA
jgi:DNA-binding CsgD family transcriptional regulator